MKLEDLSQLELIHSFLMVIGVESELSVAEGMVRILSHGEFLSKKNITIQTFDSLAPYLNVVKIIERYGIEISIKASAETQQKIYTCTRFNGHGGGFESASLLEAILMVIVDWKFRDKLIDNKQELDTFEIKEVIPLDSLGLSFSLNLILRRNKITHVADFNGLNTISILEILSNKQELLDELRAKLKEIGINI